MLQEDVFSVTENSVNCPDAKFENTFNYRFQNVFNGLKELQSAFDRVYAPMVRQTIAGESTLLAFCGLPISDSMEYFTSVNGRAGIINMAAQLLLRAACTDAKKPGTVTLSWYKIDCGPSEAVTDLLRSSSALHAHRGADPNLVLRELGKGRGMIVPGLWEVELTTPQDADAVIGHVLKMLPTSVHDGKSHSVFQLTISPYDQTQKANYQHVGSRATIVDDSRGVGRLTMVLLSDLGPIRNASYAESPSPSVVERYDWVNIAYDILHWIESRRPSPPFHRSRLMLLLRDAVCSRMHGAISLFLVPSVQSLPDNSSWLDLVTKIFHISDQRLSAVNAVNAAAKALTDAQTSSLLAAAAAANIPPPGRFSVDQREVSAVSRAPGQATKSGSATKARPGGSSSRNSQDRVQQAWGFEGHALSTDDSHVERERDSAGGGHRQHVVEYSAEDRSHSSAPYGDPFDTRPYHYDGDGQNESFGVDDGSPPTVRRQLQYQQVDGPSHASDQGEKRGEYATLEARRVPYGAQDGGIQAADLSARDSIDTPGPPLTTESYRREGLSEYHQRPAAELPEGALDSEVPLYYQYIYCCT